MMSSVVVLIVEGGKSRDGRCDRALGHTPSGVSSVCGTNSYAARNATTLVWPACLSSKTPICQPLIASRMASRPLIPSMAPTSIAGPATFRRCRKAAVVDGLFHSFLAGARCRFLARNGPVGPVYRCPFIGCRKCLADGRNGANDPEVNMHMLPTRGIDLAAD